MRKDTGAACVLMILFVGCMSNEQSTTHKDSSKTAIIPTATSLIGSGYLKKVVVDFKSRHPEYLNNDILTKDLSDSLSDILYSLIKKGAYDSIPFTYGRIEQDYATDKYIAYFDYSDDSKGQNRIGMEVEALIPKSMVKELVNFKKYYVRGKVEKMILGTGLTKDFVVLPFVRMKVDRLIPVSN